MPGHAEDAAQSAAPSNEKTRKSKGSSQARQRATSTGTDSRTKQRGRSSASAEMGSGAEYAESTRDRRAGPRSGLGRGEEAEPHGNSGFEGFDQSAYIQPHQRGGLQPGFRSTGLGAAGFPGHQTRVNEQQPQPLGGRIYRPHDFMRQSAFGRQSPLGAAGTVHSGLRGTGLQGVGIPQASAGQTYRPQTLRRRPGTGQQNPLGAAATYRTDAQGQQRATKVPQAAGLGPLRAPRPNLEPFLSSPKFVQRPPSSHGRATPQYGNTGSLYGSAADQMAPADSYSTAGWQEGDAFVAPAAGTTRLGAVGRRSAPPAMGNGATGSESGAGNHPVLLACW